MRFPRTDDGFMRDWFLSLALLALFAGFIFFRDKLEEKGEENPAYGTCCLLPAILGAFVLLLWLRFFS